MNNQSVYISVRLDKDTAKALDAIALKEHKSRSDIIRSFLYKAIQGEGYFKDMEQQLHEIKSALKEVLDPAVNRLAAIGAKNAQMSGANYIFMIYLAKLIAGYDGAKQIDEMAEQARTCGIELLKAKEEAMDGTFKKARKATDDYL